MKTASQHTARIIAIVSFIGLLAGCVTTQMTSQWRDPGFANRSIRNDRVLVLCQTRDETLRRICEDQWTAQLGRHGIPSVRSYSLPGFPTGGAPSPDEIKSAALNNNVSAVISMQLNPSDHAVVNSGPQVGVGVGGGSGGGYRGGGFSFGGIGFSIPVGGASTTQGMNSVSTLVDVASGAAFWSGNASSPASADLSTQVSELTRITTEALKTAGII